MTSLLRALKSKSKSRNPKHIRNHKLECFNLETAVGRKKDRTDCFEHFWYWSFECVSDFEIRISNLAYDISAFVIVGSQV